MKWIVFALVVGCQSGTASKPPAPTTAAPPGAPGPVPANVTPEYKHDIENLCEVIHRSGADELPEGDRGPTIAMWLGPNIKTEAGHDFLVAIQPLVGEPKAKALDAEARRVGLDTCALAAEWR